TATVTHSLVEGGYTGTGNINADPLFVNPQPASAAPTTLGDYRLQACSPAINIGNNADIPFGITTDLDNNPRIAYTDVDLGAYEQQTNIYKDGNFTTWKGVNTNWHDKVNWCGGFIPSSTVDVTIPSSLSNYPLLSSAGSTKNIILNNGSSVSVAATAQLTINGTYTNNGSVIFNLGTWVMAGNAVGQSFPGAAGSVSDMNNLEINNSNGITMDKSFSITGSLIPTSGNINVNNATIRLRSTATGTASIAAVQPGASISYTGTGKFEIQRYINTGTGTGQHGKSWQFLSAAVSGQSVFQSWQENGLTTPGFGTWITGTGTGFDATTVLPSIKSFNTATNGWTPVVNTGAALYNKLGYMLFVRGDRTVNTYNGTPNTTVMRISGQVHSPSNPPPSVPVAANKFQSFGNPYPSRIEFSKVRALSTGIDDVFYVWDPLIPGNFNLGGWQTISGVTGYIPTVGLPPTGNAASAYYPAGIAAPYIESGSAVFVHGNAAGGNLNFNESCKVAGSRLVNRPGGNIGQQQVKALLSAALYNHAGLIADGNIVVFGRDFSADVNADDAIKIMNDGENFGLSRSGKLLAVESRSVLNTDDTIFYYLSNLRQQTYQLGFAPRNFDNYLNAWLIDRYSNTIQEISMRDSSFYNFSVTADVASTRPDRFIIVFRKKKKNHNNISASQEDRLYGNSMMQHVTMQVYPNPIKDNTIQIYLHGIKQGRYRLMLIDNLERIVQLEMIDHKTNGMLHLIQVNQKTAPGIYRLRLVDTDKEISVASVLIE
ncbi:MAG: hypothetical protein JST02_09095, partial [Bacteroidetes bacterium]|nr:hypothetical protein [Bacteroidota bacterium]